MHSENIPFKLLGMIFKFDKSIVLIFEQGSKAFAKKLVKSLKSFLKVIVQSESVHPISKSSPPKLGLDDNVPSKVNEIDP